MDREQEDRYTPPPTRVTEPFVLVPEEMLYGGTNLYPDSPRISHRAVLVYMSLARHGESFDRCYPSRNRLSYLLGVSIDTVKRSIKELKDAGWITTKETFREDGSQGSNAYTVHRRRRVREPCSAQREVRSCSAPPGAPVRPLEREQDHNEKTKLKLCASGGRAPSSRKPETETAQVIRSFSFPLKDGSTGKAPPSMIREAERLVTSGDYDLEVIRISMAEAAKWCLRNPSKRKTQRGLKAFLLRWIDKEQTNRNARLETIRRDPELRDNSKGQWHRLGSDEEDY